MPVTATDPKTALVVIDLQKSHVRRETISPGAQILANAVRLVDAFRAKNLPVVLVRVGWTSPDRADAVRVRTEAPPPGPLPSDFFEYRRRRIANIVLCGISTSIGVESTARDAYERGYNLTFASDAMTDVDADAYGRALEIIFPR